MQPAVDSYRGDQRGECWWRCMVSDLHVIECGSPRITYVLVLVVNVQRFNGAHGGNW